MADAMEMMILSILSPILMCEWGLLNYEEALITTVCNHRFLFTSILFW